MRDLKKVKKHYFTRRAGQLKLVEPGFFLLVRAFKQLGLLNFLTYLDFKNLFVNYKRKKINEFKFLEIKNSEIK